jgi:hypothetical protein
MAPVATTTTATNGTSNGTSSGKHTLGSAELIRLEHEYGAHK